MFLRFKFLDGGGGCDIDVVSEEIQLDSEDASEVSEGI